MIELTTAALFLIGLCAWWMRRKPKVTAYAEEIKNFAALKVLGYFESKAAARNASIKRLAELELELARPHNLWTVDGIEARIKIRIEITSLEKELGLK